MLISGQRPQLAAMAQKRVKAIAEMRKLLWSALTVLFANGESSGGNDAVSDRASRYAQPFEQREDHLFFADLQQEIDAEETQREEVYLQWLLALAARAEQVLRHAFIAGPRSNMQRYKAQSAALSRFDAGLRSSKSFPELANHFARQRASRTAHAASDSEGAHHA